MAYKSSAPKPLPFDQIDTASIDLGDRFIHRIDDFGCYYVQLRARSNGKMHYGPAKTFYDNQHGDTNEEGREKAKEAAYKFRDENVWEFFRKIDYDPTYRDRQRAHAKRERERPKKFTIRKEAKSGLMSDIRYIRILKRKNQQVRCVLEVTVNVYGEHFTSKAYSYTFSKYGGKAEAIKAAKKDRDVLAELVHKKAALLNKQPKMSKQETRDEVKSVLISQTMPQVEFDPDKYMRRSFDNTCWIVKLRKQINHYDFRPLSQRFFDADYEGKKHKSRIAARRYILGTMADLNEEARIIKNSGITDHEHIEQIFESVLEKNREHEGRIEHRNGSIAKVERKEAS